MSFSRILNISSEYLFNKIKSDYAIPESLIGKDFYAIELKQVPQPLLDYLKDLDRKDIFYNKNICDTILFTGTHLSMQQLLQNLNNFDNKYCAGISDTINNYFEYNKKKFSLGGKEYELSVPCIMGIVNVTPDSFSDGGKYFTKNDAVQHAVELINNKADILDIGGESTRPGSEPVTLNEELNRVIPVIEEIRSLYPDLVLSIDTTKSRVAYEALKRGVKIVNDISGLSFDPEIPDVVKEFNASLVIMHIKGTPKDMQINPEYYDIFSEVYNFLEEKISLAKSKGISDLIIDPGIGFGKRLKDNYELLLRLDEFKNMGYPILVGLSNKSFLGKALNLDINNREVATVISETYSIFKGAGIIRTHNVKNAVQAKELYKLLTNPEILS